MILNLKLVKHGIITEQFTQKQKYKIDTHKNVYKVPTNNNNQIPQAVTI